MYFRSVFHLLGVVSYHKENLNTLIDHYPFDSIFLILNEYNNEKFNVTRHNFLTFLQIFLEGFL
jgi:hypothetical protein